MFAEIPLFNAPRPDAPQTPGPGWTPEVRETRRGVVFDRARSEATNPAVRMGLAGANGMDMSAVAFTRNDADRRPPREVVTARFFGDPKPNRLEIAEAIRRRVMAKSVTLEPVSVTNLLRALLKGQMGAREVAEHLGCSPSAASDRAKRARAFGYLEVIEHRSHTGRLRTYKITDAGRDYLAGAASQ
jgi:hypothetical protein